jgi:hypothetical protein
MFRPRDNSQPSSGDEKLTYARGDRSENEAMAGRTVRLIYPGRAPRLVGGVVQPCGVNEIASGGRVYAAGQ